jgi:adenylate cyclase
MHARWMPAFASLANPAASGSAAGRRLAGIVVTAVAVAVFVAAIAQTSPWRLLEARAYDYLSTFAAPPLPADGPVIVAIDEPSMAEIGRQWPWPRSLHARLVGALREAGAEAIGIDLIFAEPSAGDDDRALAAALGPDVVLAGDETLVTAPQADQIVRVEPLPEFTAGGAQVGIASIALDGDATMRRLPAYADGLAVRLLDLAGRPRRPAAPGALIQTFGPARTYPTVSYYQALDPRRFLPKDLLRGRTVIVGLSMQASPTADKGGADAHATAYTVHDGHLVSGAEIQATIYDNLAHGLLVAPASRPLALAAVALATILAGAMVWRGTGWRTLPWTVAGMAIAVAGCWVGLRHGRVFVPPLAPSLAFLLVAGVQSGRDYAAERRLRRGITRAFSRYLSPVMVERLARDPRQLRLGGERRTLSVLFCDVRGFTTIAEGMKDEPERLTALVNRLLNPLSQVVLAAGGTIDKYMGDCIMAFWNAPLDDPDHALHAVEAALGIVVALGALNAEIAAEAKGGAPPLHLRVGVGINTGGCVVGNMGSDIRFDYSAIGDAVNLASRLEGQTRNYDVPILIGEETARLVAARHAVVELDRIAVKGRAGTAAVSTIVPAATPQALELHRAVLAAHYAGGLRPDDARLDEMARLVPALAGYYAAMRVRLLAPAGG